MDFVRNVPTIVPAYDVPPGSRWTIDGMEYAYQKRLPDGHMVARIDRPQMSEFFSHADVLDLFRDDAIRIDEGYFSAAKTELRAAQGRKSFDKLNGPQTEKVMFKEEWCLRFLALEASDRNVRRSDAKVGLAILRIAADMDAERARAAEYRKARGGSVMPGRPKPPSTSQLKRWIRRYEKAGRDDLIDQYNGPGTILLALDADSYEVHQKYATKYASRNRPTKASLFLELEEALNEADRERIQRGEPKLRRLKRRAFEKMISALDPFYVCAGREGHDKALKLWGMKSTGLDVEKPFERLEMDEWKVSLSTLLIDAGVWGLLTKEQKDKVERTRTWLSVAIDARTRMIVAMRLLETAPTVESALATLELVMIDKSRIASHVGTSSTYVHGKPRSLAMDNGTNFTATEVLKRTVQLGISPVHPPAGLASMRARIERVFLTLRTKILSHFSGQTFANIFEKGDYDPAENASLNFEQLNEVFIRGVLDLYHNHPHEGLLSETPYNCMRRLSRDYGLPLPPHRDVLRHVLGVSCERRIGIGGVRFLGIMYQSKELQRLRRDVRQRAVEIRVNRYDLSSISVRTERDGWITVHACHRQLFEGVNVWTWIEAARDLRKRNLDVANLSRSVVLDAVRHLSEAGAEAVRRAEIVDPVLTDKLFKQCERQLLRGLSFADDGGWGEEPHVFADRGSVPTAAAVRQDTNADGRAPDADHDVRDPIGEEPDDENDFGNPDEWSSN